MSTSTSNLKTYTVQRLIKAETKALPEEFCVGGKIIHRESQVILTDFVNEILISDSHFNLKPAVVSLTLSKKAIVESDGRWEIKTVNSVEHFFDLAIDEFVSPGFNPKMYLKWQDFLFSVRSVLRNLSMTEVQTPILVENPGPEPTLSPFRTELVFGGTKKNLYLPTSPELHLKKLLSFGFVDIFELSRSFRNEEISPIHEPEFTMLEVYKSFSKLEEFKGFVEAFLKSLARSVNSNLNFEKAKSFSVKELFEGVVNFDLKPDTKKQELIEVCQRLKLDISETDSWNDLFFRIFIEYIEPQLATYQQPVFVYNYPPSQSALSKINNDGWANRFELYWRGVELGNAFDELTNIHAQMQRTIADNLEKLTLGKMILPIDVDYLNALKSGLPQTCGIAIGLERLFCVMFEVGPIQKVMPFNWNWKANRDW